MNLNPQETVALLLGKADNRALVESLVAHEVPFVIVGGTAVAANGARDPADVDDLDLLVPHTLGAAEKVCAALESIGIPLSQPARSLARPAIPVPIKTQQFWAEILTPRRGLEFTLVAQNAIRVNITGTSLLVACSKDLIQMKKDAVHDLTKNLEKHQRDLDNLHGA